MDALGQFREHRRQLEISNQTGGSRGSVDRTPSGSVEENTMAKLAPITLPKFSGDPQEWSRFSDIFKSTVVNSRAFSDAVKFHYLQAHLAGEASLLIAGIPLEGTNF